MPKLTCAALARRYETARANLNKAAKHGTKKEMAKYRAQSERLYKSLAEKRCK